MMRLQCDRGGLCFSGVQMSGTRNFFAPAIALAMSVSPLLAQQTGELEQIARDLNQALGRQSAVVERRAPSRVVVPAAEDVRVSSSPMAEALVEAMNRERAAYGLQPLHLNPQLSLAASDRISDMFAKHYFDHVSPDGIDPFTWVDKRGYDYTEVGENLAVGYRDASGVVDGWMHSPHHRANILKGHFDEVGIALAPGSPTHRYTGPTVVVLYGSRS
jgi:uncharacterized protein YkwD